MTSNSDVLPAIVVGAGWAGLGVSDLLKREDLSHRVLERLRHGNRADLTLALLITATGNVCWAFQ